jgi:hypothetical protein
MTLPHAPSKRVERALWLVVAVLSVLPAAAGPPAVVGDGVDAFGTWWFFWWIRTAIEHLGDPSHTDMFFYPDGKNIFAHTGNNFVDAVLSVPFQWLFGERYFPVFVVVTMLGNAVAFRALADEALGAVDEGAERAFAPFAATLLWMVNPFTLFELTAGRTTQAFLWFLPVAVAAFLRSARTGSVRDAVVLGVATALSAWTYWFNGFFLALGFAALAPFSMREAEARGRAVRAWGIGAAVCLLLVGPAVYAMSSAAAEGHVVGMVSSGGGGPPTTVQNNVSEALHGLWLMERYGAPQLLQPAWGLTLLAALVVPGVRVSGGRARWGVLALVAVLFALGPAIMDGGTVIAPVPWYQVAQAHIPFLDRLWFPYRLVVLALLAAALLNGALCAHVRWPRALLALLVSVSLLGQAAVGIWPLAHHAARPPDMVSDLRGRGGGVLFFPFRLQHDGLMWQTRFQLPTFGGMGESASVFWPRALRRRLSNPFVRALRGATLLPPSPAPWAARDREEFEAQGFRWIILRPSLVQSEHLREADMRGRDVDTRETLRAAIAALSITIGRPADGLDGDALLWDLRGSWQAQDAWRVTHERLHALETVPAAGRTAYERGLLDLGRDGSGQQR